MEIPTYINGHLKELIPDNFYLCQRCLKFNIILGFDLILDWFKLKMNDKVKFLKVFNMKILPVKLAHIMKGLKLCHFNYVFPETIIYILASSVY